jgi:uncharacterized delta-60 repeat protein
MSRRRLLFQALEGRYLLASVSGIAFQDINEDGVKGLGEPVLDEWRVHPDENDNSSFDTGGPSKVTETAIPTGYYLPPQPHAFGSVSFLTGPSDSPPLDIALEYLSQHAIEWGLTPEDVNRPLVTDHYVSGITRTTHIYLRQQFNGLEVANANMNVNITADGRVINVGGGFVSLAGGTGNKSDLESPQALLSGPQLTAAEAIEAAAVQLGLKSQWSSVPIDSVEESLQSEVFVSKGISLDPIPVRQHYVATPDGLVLAWDIVLRTPDLEHWYDVSVDGSTGDVLLVADWIADATYNVLPAPIETPIDGSRAIVTDPQNPAASPFGWHDTDGVAGAEFTDTRGNNVFAQEDGDADNTGGLRPDGGAGLNFDFPLDLGQTPDAYQNAAITNLFYWNNHIHDVLYQYGFDEASGNFQVNNYGRGGIGNDAVQADAQDGSATNNANFGTPPDGSTPRMQMFIWNYADPDRDSDFDNQIIVHEYGHGVSHRLTGGPANSGSLGGLQSGGMGEGWGDWLGLMFTMKPSDLKLGAYSVGTYVKNQAPTGNGIRRYPYSFDMSINPETYGLYNSSNEVHDSGEIWTSALWDLTWLLIDKHGYNSNLFGAYDTGGNNLAVQLVLDGMKIQPVNPSFLDARDAILLADQVLTSGANQTEIWNAFARRGMGFSAYDGGSSSATTVIEAFDMPHPDPVIFRHSPVGSVVGPLSSIDFTFSEAMDMSSFVVANDVVSFTGPGGGDLSSQITGFSWLDSKSLRITLTGQSADGDYTLTLGPQILSADNGHALDQDRDGNIGEATDDRYSATIEIDHCPGPDGFGYQACAATFENIDLIPAATGVVTLLEGVNNTTAVVDLGTDTFNFYGTSYTGNGQLFVSDNGLITFGSGTGAFGNTDLGTFPSQAALAPLWDAWRTDYDGGATEDQVLGKFEDLNGDSNNDRLVLEWNRVRHSAGAVSQHVTFQAVLQLNTGGRPGAITFNYADLDINSPSLNNGGSATVGIKASGIQGANRLLVAMNNGSHPFIASGTAILISPDTADNDPPVNRVPNAVSASIGATVTFSASTGNSISVDDPDVGNSDLKVTLTTTNGDLTLNGVADLTFSDGDGTGDASMTFAGKLLDINTALDGMQFRPLDGFVGQAMLQITTDDLGHSGPGGPLTDTDLVTIFVGRPGSLDLTFDFDGKLTTSFGVSGQQANSVVLQPDGKIVVAGQHTVGDGDHFAVARYNPDGTLDTSFDSDGKVTKSVGGAGYYSYAYSAAIQPDGKIVVAGTSAGRFALLRLNSDGSLDSSFDGDGQVLTLVGSGGGAYDVAIQSDGKIVAAGYAYNGSDYDFALARYNLDGSLDSTFDSDGKLTTAFGSGHDYARSLAIQSDDKIVVVGYAYNGTNNDFALARYNPDGSLDTTFDGDGQLLTPIGAGHDYAYSVALQSDGKIVAGGYSDNYFALARYNPNGSADSTFDGDGKLTTLVGSSAYARAIAIQSDGKIIAVGYSWSGTNYDFAAARYLTSGALDVTFDSDGTLVTPFDSISSDSANALAIQSDGRIVTAGISGHDLALARYTSAGKLDPTFDGDGEVTTPFGQGSDQAIDIAIQPDGKIVAVGYSYNGSNYDFALSRYNPDGGLDPSFGVNGQASTAFQSYLSDQAYAVAIQSDGKIVVAGTSNGAFALARYLTDGTLDTSFDSDGKVTTSISANFGFAQSLAIQPDGKIVVAGYWYNGSDYDFALARYNLDGSLDTSFDGDGKILTPIGPGYDYIEGVALQSDGKIVAVGYAYNGSDSDFAVARYNIDGSLDTTFDGDGKVLTAIGSGSDLAYSIAIQPDGKLVLAGYSSSHFALARYESDGSLDSSFDGDGKVITPVGPSYGYAYALTIQLDGKIVVVGRGYNLSNYDLALARYNSDGSLDTTFDGAGTVLTPLGLGNDEARAVAVQSDGRIVVAGFSESDGQKDFALARYQGDGPATFGISDITIDEDAADTLVDLFAAFADPTDADSALTYTITGNTNAGLFTSTTINGTFGTLALDYAPNQSGSAEITIRATDPVGWFVDTTFTVVVNPSNDAPAGTDNTVTTFEDTAYTFTANDFGFTDPTDSPAHAFLAVKITTLASAGILKLTSTSVSAGNFISKSDLDAGKLTFTPPLNANGVGLAQFTFQVQDDGGTASNGVDLDATPNTLTITVTPVGDTPQVADITTLEDTLSEAIVINRNAADGTEVTHFKITGITGGALFQNDGTTPITNGDYVTYAQAQSGVKFLPATNSIVPGHFDVESSQDGTSIAAQSGKATSTITVTPVGDTPLVSDITTLEDTLSGAIVINRNAADGTEVTHFKISSITGGTLLQNNGTTPITNGDYITFAQAQSGVKFLPTANSTVSGHFDVESSQTGTTVASQSGKATSTITVTPVGDTPLVADITTLEDTLSGLIVISRNAADGVEVTHFKISGISGGTLFQDNGTTPITNGGYVTFAQAQSGVKFLPSANNTVPGHFDVESSQDGSTVATQSGKATSTITVTPVGDTPLVADITTLEDTLSGAIVINRNAADGTEVTHFKISGISGGTLFQNNGTTPITNGDYVTLAQAQSGVKFLPTANSTTTGHFDVESSQDGSTVAAQSGKSTSTITVTPVGDTPLASDITTLEDTLSEAIVISRNPADGAEVTHFRISGITGGVLFQNNGTMPINNGDYITFAQAQSGVKFLASANSTVSGHFDVESSQDGSTVAAQSGKATSTISVTPVGDTPQVSDITTLEDTLSVAIAINRHETDGTEVTHFRISGITGGTLFKSNGITPIANDSFVTYAEGQAGVKFLPSVNSNAAGQFDVESSQDGTTVAAQSGKATSTTTVTPVGDTPRVSGTTTVEDTLSGSIVIDRHAADGPEVTHFKISGITGGVLFQNDGTTPINNGEFVTLAEAQAGVKFLPATNSTTVAHFDVESSQDGSTVAAQSDKATGIITITPVGDTPQVSDITTLEDTLSVAIAINRHATDGPEVTHFKISNITGGALFKSDGSTSIASNSFITYAEGQAGVKFLPSANSNAAGHFDVESSQDGSSVAAQSGKATSTITIIPVGDTPQVADVTTLEDTLSGAIVIARHATDGPEVTQFKISNITGGTLFKSDGSTPIANNSFITYIEGQAGVKFLPSADSNSAGHFDVESSQGGSSVAAQSGKATSTITITPVGDTPRVADVTTLEDTLSAATVINRHISDGPEVTHFRISNITGGTLFKSDGSTSIASNSFITFAEGQAGVKFLPFMNSNSAGRFDVESSQGGGAVAAQSGKAISTINITPVGDTPQVVDITTLEDTLSGAIVINRNAADGAEVTHFKISGITGGTLFQSNGTTPINNGGFITFAQAQAEVKFLPSANSTAAGQFEVESSQDGSTVAAQSGKAISTITVTPVNDTPDGLFLSANSLLENIDTSSAVLVGTLTTSDADVGDSHTYTLVAGSGDTDNGAFQVTGSQLLVKAGTVLDRETQASYAIRVATTDAAGQAFEQAFTIGVSDVNDPPELATIGNKSVDEGSLLTFTPSASDADVPANTLTFSLDAGAPSGASIDANSGVFTWTPSEAQGPGAFNITVRVTDNGTPNLNDFETIEVSVSEVNAAPILASIGNQSVNEGSLLTFTAGVSDADVPANTLTFSLDAGAPSGASIDANSGVFTWTPSEAQGPGTFNITVRVTDNGTPNLNDFETIEVTVGEVNAAPVLAGIDNKSVNEGSLLTFTASASDGDVPANTLTFSLDAGAPSGARLKGRGHSTSRSALPITAHRT